MKRIKSYYVILYPTGYKEFETKVKAVREFKKAEKENFKGNLMLVRIVELKNKKPLYCLFTGKLLSKMSIKNRVNTILWVTKG